MISSFEAILSRISVRLGQEHDLFSYVGAGFIKPVDVRYRNGCHYANLARTEPENIKPAHEIIVSLP
jgi:hypothetical protein